MAAPWSKMAYTKKSSSQELGSDALSLVYSISFWSYTKFVQMVAPGSKMALLKGVFSMNYIHCTRNIFKYLLKDRLAQLLCLVVLYQTSSNGSPRVQNRPVAGDFGSKVKYT